MKAKAVFQENVALTDLGGGVSRRVLSYTPEMMMVEVHFEKDAVGAIHAHPHVQCTYVLSGHFRFTMEDREVQVKTGDTLAFPSGVRHGTLCLESGVLLDVFTPMREEFVK